MRDFSSVFRTFIPGEQAVEFIVWGNPLHFERFELGTAESGHLASTEGREDGAVVISGVNTGAAQARGKRLRPTSTGP